LAFKEFIYISKVRYSYLIVRGGILGSGKDELLRKHLPILYLLIKNDS